LPLGDIHPPKYPSELWAKTGEHLPTLGWADISQDPGNKIHDGKNYCPKIKPSALQRAPLNK
jgi:hypothetical protein